MNIDIHTDGGARGNPGPAAIGVVISHQGSTKTAIASFGKTIGEATNNVAEYTAVLEALKFLKSWRTTHKEPEHLKFHFYLDSTLVVNQINGLFKVKEPTLQLLRMEALALIQEVGECNFVSIPREQNQEADLLVNQALDAR